MSVLNALLFVISSIVFIPSVVLLSLYASKELDNGVKSSGANFVLIDNIMMTISTGSMILLVLYSYIFSRKEESKENMDFINFIEKRDANSWGDIVVAYMLNVSFIFSIVAYAVNCNGGKCYTLTSPLHAMILIYVHCIFVGALYALVFLCGFFGVHCLHDINMKWNGFMARRLNPQANQPSDAHAPV